MAAFTETDQTWHLLQAIVELDPRAMQVTQMPELLERLKEVRIK